jgi:hypothetical protein
MGTKIAAAAKTSLEENDMIVCKPLGTAGGKTRGEAFVQ